MKNHLNIIFNKISEIISRDLWMHRAYCKGKYNQYNSFKAECLKKTTP